MCPTLNEVAMTPKQDRWDVWDDPSCRSGCRIVNCGDNIPCCVKPKGGGSGGPLTTKWQQRPESLGNVKPASQIGGRSPVDWLLKQPTKWQKQQRSQSQGNAKPP